MSAIRESAAASSVRANPPNHRPCRAEQALNEGFWTERLRTHGHTGWADPVIYAYDQMERLRLVEQMLSKAPRQPGIALDFGCGTGDFSKLLLRLGFSVCGYDPFVRPRITSKQFLYADSLNGISISDCSADVALSVTALDHILDEPELHRALATIRRCLKCEGVFYMLEYALDPEDAEKFPSQNDYQSFRSLRKWKELLQSHSLGLLDLTPVPHPHHSPSSGYLLYTRSVLVRTRRRFSRLPLAKCLDPLLRWEARRLVQNRPTPLKGTSPLKLMRCCVQ